MRTDEYITGLRKEHNIVITVDNNELKIKGLQQSLTPEIVEEIRARKTEIISFFNAAGEAGREGGIPKAVRKDCYTLSSAQKRMYFLSRMDKGSLAYNIPRIDKLTGRPDKGKLQAAFNKLVERHEILRTTFEEVDGIPAQRVLNEVALVIEDYPGGDPDGAVAKFIRPFDLSRDLLIRVGLVELGPQEHLLLIDMHHIISDGVSQGLLMKEFVALYNEESLPPMRLQYRDYSEWQQSGEQKGRLAAQKQFWLEEFKERPDTLKLPLDYPRPLIKGYRGSSIGFEIGEADTAALKAIAEEQETTLFMVLLSLFNIFLARLSNLEDIVVGTPISGRRHADMENMIGMFVNTLPLRNYPRGELRYSQFLEALRTRTISCFDNQSFAYEELINELNVERDTSRNPLFDVMFVFQNYEEVAMQIPGLALEPVNREEPVSKFDITLKAQETAGKIVLAFEYATDLFTAATIGRFITYFIHIASGVAADEQVRLSDIQLLPEAEKKELLERFNDNKVVYPAPTVMDLFMAQVAKTPANVAIKYADTVLSYRELEESSARVAACLQEMGGVRPGDRVGVMVRRGPWLVPAIFGILRAGAAYVPIDPDYPRARIGEILADADPKVLITEKECRPKVEEAKVGEAKVGGLKAGGFRVLDTEELADFTYSGAANPVINRRPEASDLAYILYTSGSTGKPKGVMIEHGSLANIIQDLQYRFPLGQQDCYLLKTTYCFDVSCAEIFGWCSAGGSLAILPDGDEKEPGRILAAIERYRVTHINFVPSMFAVFTEQKGLDDSIGSLKYVFLAGEVFPAQLAEKFYKPGIQLWNLYGPTEGTIYCSGFNAADRNGAMHTIPIGRPLANIRLYVLDKHASLQPVGVPGELCIGGKAVARGYWHNDDLSRQSFPADPFYPGERMYRTGDIAMWKPDGTLEYIGRADSQVKIRGFRIEQGEVENRLAMHPSIHKVVVLTAGKDGDRFLVAYYSSDKPVETPDFRDFLLKSLPDYMVPSCFIHLSAWPLNANGKLDIHALPDPVRKAGKEYIAPRTKEEKLLAEIWTKVLGVDRIGITDNFFTTGGDSIKSIQICSRVRSAGYDLSVKDTFTHQTIRQLAGALKKLSGMTDQSLVTGTAPLSPIQQWFFEGPMGRKDHFNHSVLLNFTEGLTKEETVKIFGKIQEHHDALRMVFLNKDGVIIQENRGLSLPLSVEEYDLRDNPGGIALLAEKIQSGIDIGTGPLMKLGLFHLNDGSRLLIVIHHLVVDGISWRILLEDIDSLYRQVTEDLPLVLPLKTDSFLSWSRRLRQYMDTPSFSKAAQYWAAFQQQATDPIPADSPEGDNLLAHHRRKSFQLSPATTSRLLTEANTTFGTGINDILLTALLLGVRKQYGVSSMLVDLESHGRKNSIPDMNIDRTVGWFTSIYPVLLECSSEDFSDHIRQTKENLRKVPGDGIDYLLCRTRIAASICFNYLGQFDTDLEGRSFVPAEEDRGAEIALNEPALYDWIISGMIRGGRMEITVSYSVRRYEDHSMARLMAYFSDQLLKLIDFCCTRTEPVLTPSDLTYKGLSIAALDALQKNYRMQDVYPLTPMQQGILYHALHDPISYFGQTTCRCSGDLDVGAIERSMNWLVMRYDVLRTVFLHEGYDRHLQLVLKEHRIDFRYEDVRGEGGPVEEKVQRCRLAERNRPFNLSRDVLMRVIVLRTGEQEYWLIWNYHHLLMDGWCMGILVGEFKKIYAAMVKREEIRLAAVRPYGHYIEWLEAQDKEAAVSYWKQYLSGYNSLSGIPRKETSVRDEYVLQQLWTALDEEHTRELYALSGKYGVTINTIFQCAWGLLLSRYNNVQDVVFGSVVSGRPAEMEGVERMVGLFINTIPVRIRYEEGDRVLDLLQAIQKRGLESPHYYALSEIQSLSELGTGLLDHIMAFENFPVVRQIEGAQGNEEELFSISQTQFFEQTNYDFNIIAFPAERLSMRFDFNVNVHEEEMIRQVAGHLNHILEGIAKDPEGLVSGISLYSKAEGAILGSELRAELEDAVKPVQELLEESFRRHGDRCAVRYKGKEYSYGEIEAHARALGSRLPASAEGSCVGVFCEDRQWLISSILGILGNRSAFVPLETTLPKSRLSSMIRQAGIRYILTDQPEERRSGLEGEIEWIVVGAAHGGKNGSLNGLNGARHEGQAAGSRKDYSPEDLLYVYFTSGSTGNPKGVAGRNKGLSHFVQWEIATFGIDASWRFSQFTNPGFDVFMRDMFVPLCAGGTICVPDVEPAEIGGWIDREKISLIHCVPSFFRLFGKNRLKEGMYGSLKYILLAGEKILPYELQEWYRAFGDRIQLVNVYGPTETTLAKGFYLIGPGDIAKGYIPVKAMKGAQFWVMDRHLHVSPRGAVGEIYIRTPYRTRGYLDAGATARSFLVNPYSGDAKDLLYRTGDLGRQHAGGEIEIIGRQDQQVKVRGIRVELDDIRENMLRYGGVREAVVVVREDREGDKTICGYYVGSSGGKVTEPGLRQYLEANLPGVMVPSWLIGLEKMPLLPNGKIDRKSLPEPGAMKAEGYVAAEGELERRLVDIWAEVLKIDSDKVSTEKTFFELGGHSVKVFFLINKMHEAFSVKLKLGDIFRHNSIKKLAVVIGSHTKKEEAGITRVAGREWYETSPAQKRIFYQHLLNENDIRYNIPVAVSLPGSVDIDTITSTFQALVDRHESLRTHFRLTDQGVMQKIAEKISFKLEHIDGYGSVEAAFNAFIRPLDLSEESLFRGAIFRSGQAHFLFVDMHHIIADGLSMDILIRDFKHLYMGQALPGLSLRYVDYAAWVNNITGKLNRQQEYWKKLLSGKLPELALPRIREKADADLHRASRLEWEMEGELYRGARQLASDSNVSDFMLLLSVYYLLLARLTGDTDIIIGTDVVGRTHPALQGIVGTFVNVLPLRLQIRPDMKYYEFLHEIRQCVAGAFENQDLQFDQMIAMIQKELGTATDNSIIEVHFSFSNIIDDTIELPEFSFYPVRSRREEVTHYELQLEAREGKGEKLILSMVYSRELYDAETIRLMMRYYRNILRQVVNDKEVPVGSIELEAAFI